MDILLYVMSSLGGLVLVAGLGLLWKHLTIDHNKIEADLEEIKKNVKLLIQKEKG